MGGCKAGAGLRSVHGQFANQTVLLEGQDDAISIVDEVCDERVALCNFAIQVVPATRVDGSLQ